MIISGPKNSKRPFNINLPKNGTPYIAAMSKRSSGTSANIKINDSSRRNKGRSTRRSRPVETHINSPGDRSSSVISMRDITPEMAAQVVKNYLLPMFDGNFIFLFFLGKTTKTKTRISKTEEVSDDPNFKPKTIYGELKLSDKLSGHLEEVRLKLKQTEEQLDEKTKEYGKLEEKYGNLKTVNRMISMKLSVYETQIESFGKYFFLNSR